MHALNAINITPHASKPASPPASRNPSVSVCLSLDNLGACAQIGREAHHVWALGLVAIGMRHKSGNEIPAAAAIALEGTCTYTCWMPKLATTHRPSKHGLLEDVQVAPNCPPLRGQSLSACDCPPPHDTAPCTNSRCAMCSFSDDLRRCAYAHVPNACNQTACRMMRQY